jgi:hypothetical protein
MSSFSSFLKNNYALLGSILTIWASMVYGAVVLLAQVLKTSHERAAFRARLRRILPYFYGWGFRKILTKIDTFLWASRSARCRTFVTAGAPFFRSRAGKATCVLYGVGTWWRCTQIAFIYPALFLLTAWALGNNPGLGGIQIFYGEIPDFIRYVLWIVFVTHLVGLMLFVETRYYKKLSFQIVCRFRFEPNTFRTYLTFVIERLLCGAVGAYVGLVFGLFCAYISPLVSLKQGLSAGASAGFTAGFVAGHISAGPLAGAVGLIFGAIAASDQVITSLIILFFGFLPAVNSIFDFLSLCMTRLILGRIIIIHLTKRKWAYPKTTGLIVGDVIFALCCIFALAVFLSLSIFVYNQFPAVPPPARVNWAQTIADAYDKPFEEGLPITFMLWWTFMPTVASFFVICFLFSISMVRQSFLFLGSSISISPKEPKVDTLWMLAVAGSVLVFVPAALIFRAIIVTVLLGETAIPMKILNLSTYVWEHAHSWQSTILRVLRP